MDQDVGSPRGREAVSRQEAAAASKCDRLQILNLYFQIFQSGKLDLAREKLSSLLSKEYVRRCRELTGDEEERVNTYLLIFYAKQIGTLIENEY